MGCACRGSGAGRTRCAGGSCSAACCACAAFGGGRGCGGDDGGGGVTNGDDYRGSLVHAVADKNGVEARGKSGEGCWERLRGHDSGLGCNDARLTGDNGGLASDDAEGVCLREIGRERVVI